jgi:hypothetical protein
MDADAAAVSASAVMRVASRSSVSAAHLGSDHAAAPAGGAGDGEHVPVPDYLSMTPDPGV